MSRAYRQLRADPLAQPLFGILIDGRWYVDVALPFSCRTSGAACIHVTGAVAWLMRPQGFHALVYVDDFVGCKASLMRARQAFDCLRAICGRLGLRLAADKCVAPVPTLIWLGCEISTERMTLRIPYEKLCAVLEECSGWLARPTMTRKALQSLLGR